MARGGEAKLQVRKGLVGDFPEEGRTFLAFQVLPLQKEQGGRSPLLGKEKNLNTFFCAEAPLEHIMKAKPPPTRRQPSQALPQNLKRFK